LIKKLPVVVHLSDSDVKELDLMKELRVDKFNLDRQLMQYAQRYGYWAELYASASAKVSKLREDLESLEAELFGRSGGNVTDKRFWIKRHPRYRAVRKRLRKWEDAERFLKFAEKAFDKKLSVLMCLNANERKEKERA